MIPSGRPSTLVGRVVAGRYRIVERLGQGGIGRVYRAEQLGLDRACAVKVIRPERRTDPVIVQRFVREARAAGRISSPHVVTLYDCGWDDDDLYIAMELLVGQSLRERLDGGPALNPEDALSVAVAIARGLGAAHQAGVLHRDLKPANVFLCTSGAVKVLDFGVAKLLHEDSPRPLTDARRVLGTPVYMSPEAARSRPVGPPADFYALGVILFELLVGAPPFRTGDPFETMRAHAQIPAPPLRQAAPWLHVPDELGTLVADLLAKDPEARPDAGAILDRLGTVQERWELDLTELSVQDDRNGGEARAGDEEDPTEVRPMPPFDAEEDSVTGLAPPPWHLYDADESTPESLPISVRPSSSSLRSAGLLSWLAALPTWMTALAALVVGAVVFVAILVVRRWLT
ncbi:MAG: serine/threonine-protein kinase [Sandaracinaceae bacterium]